MIIRKILVNIIVALIGFPLFLSIKYWPNIIKGQYQYYDGYYDSLYDYIYVVALHPMAYPLAPILFLVFFSLPFQLLKDYCLKKGKTFSFIQKIAALSVVIACIFLLYGGFMRFWFVIGYAFCFGLYFTTLLYFLIDRYEEQSSKQLAD